MSVLTKKHKSYLLKYRTYAFTLDLFIITLLNKVIIQSYGLYLKTVFFHYPQAKQLEILAGIDKVFLGILSLLFVSYFTFSYYLGQGQTPGKIIFGIKIVDKNYNSPGIVASFLRTIGYIFCYITGLLLFALPYFTKKGSGFQDWFSRSSVVRTNSLLIPSAELVQFTGTTELEEEKIAA
ncbi:MAG: RDD family protein [Bacteriovoracaceae bacterium]|nr:RDD family protein [Bacteriovoracaceae bacterium]